MTSQFLVISVICMLACVSQINGFKVIAPIRRSSNTICMAGFGAKKEIVDTGKVITRVADAAAPCKSTHSH